MDSVIFTDGNSGCADRHAPRKKAKVAHAYGLTSQIRVVATLLALSLAMTLGTVLWSAYRQDEIVIEDSRHLASSVLGILQSNLESTLTDYTYWTEAYENTVATFNVNWFDENYGDWPYLRENFGVTATLVIGPNDHVLRHLHDPAVVTHDRIGAVDHHIQGGLSDLVQTARRAVDGAFVVAGGLVQEDGRIYLAAVRVIHPHTDDLIRQAAITPENAYVAVFLRQIDDDVFQSMAADFGLDGLIHITDETSFDGATLPLRAVTGETFGALAWQVDRPSRHVCGVVLPALLTVILCIAALSMYVLRGMRRGQTDLLQSMQRAESADRTKTEFLANMSHELRTPLNAIIGFSESMRLEMFGPLGHEKYAEYNDLIYESGQHLLSIVNDILELSKIEAGQHSLNESEFSLREAAESAYRLVKSRADEKEIEVITKVSSDFPNISADERAIKQILLNLLSNSIKFTPEGGRIFLQLFCNSDSEIQIILSDTGIGIPKEHLGLVFRPFHQVAEPLSRSEGGAGLGLPLVASLVAEHDGNIRISSEVNRGTTVVVTFPRHRVVSP